ncbi:ATP-dependent RNA helicase [Halothiobacillus diazotrophicus]|uniref:ATP-dependent RNA helicase DeaD n=1 Tax=Halothiobacillus diazotrophicus TaxID=1860122 RepID=A0A191ZGE0_9GAMM|nr:DEAD/DEAH box helicase [Halothiobacillus diazotrophicus]ANJ66933.1 ATP-dependent RNA helicase [Halothiobacillus diazotrophicus]
MSEENAILFSDLALSEPLLRAIEELGYEAPSPIQAKSIPPLLEGRDVLGMAQTGTGKTGAFSLPLLSRIDLNLRAPQLLVLAPTRELAIQVAEAMQAYARHLPDFHVLPIYGGQAMEPQLRGLKRGVHVVVGTPGRIQDHLKRGTLKLNQLQAVVLDEADEMLRMGFIDDVDEILSKTPASRQVALFSATMPEQIRRIAQRHLRSPVEISIKASTSTVQTITQRYWPVSGVHKLDALTRILEVENFDAVIIFVRTKVATTELAEKLEARGYAAAALNGDMNQALREKAIDRLKRGSLDIVIATDVAARGIDVARVSHVINYDIPLDTESYVHRIGRTGRAGRSGEAILFVAPREKRMLSAIERATGQPITPMRLPSQSDIADKRSADFKNQITEAMESQELDFFETLIEQYQTEHDVGLAEIAAALAYMAQKDRPLLPDEIPETPSHAFSERPRRDDNRRDEPRQRRNDDIPRVKYRIEIGRDQGVAPKNIVGALANEAGIDSKYIGAIRIFDQYSTVDLPEGMPNEVFNQLKRLHVLGVPLNISEAGPNDGDESSHRPPSRKFGPRGGNDGFGGKPRRPKQRY